MNTWFDPADFSRPVITAQRHVTSRHGSAVPITLPPVGVLFEMGRALDQLTQDFTTEVIADRLPCFLDNPPCLRLKDHPQVCFTKGGYGAPAAVDTLETLLALGVKKGDYRRLMRRFRSAGTGWRCCDSDADSQ